MNSKLLTGDDAQRLGLSPDRVRQLERAGVLLAQRTPTGLRLYDRDVVERLAAERAQRRKARGW